MATGWDAEAETTPGGWDEAETSSGGWDEADTVAPETVEEGPLAAADDGADDWADDGMIRLGARPNAAILRDALLALPGLGGARIDASEIERLPGPVFQVLLIAMRDALGAGGRIKIVNPSFAFGLCFEAFGLGGDLEPFEAEYV